MLFCNSYFGSASIGEEEKWGLAIVRGVCIAGRCPENLSAYLGCVWKTCWRNDSLVLAESDVAGLGSARLVSPMATSRQPQPQRNQPQQPAHLRRAGGWHFAPPAIVVGSSGVMAGVEVAALTLLWLVPLGHGRGSGYGRDKSS